MCMLHNTEIFQCFLSAREVARSRDRERASSSTGLGSGSVSRSGGVGGGEDDTILSQEGRRGSTGLPEGQDLYTAACNSVIHRCALLVLGVSPVLGEMTKQNQEDGQAQSATGTQECLSFMTRSEHLDTVRGEEVVKQNSVPIDRNIPFLGEMGSLVSRKYHVVSSTEFKVNFS